MNEPYMMNEDELYHYGRKGMKWGQHIFGKVARTTAKAYRSAKEKSASKKADKIAKQRSKITSSRKLTDAELKDRISRMKLEKEYRDLLKDTGRITKGQTFVEEVATSVGKNLVTQVGNHYGSKVLNKWIGEEVIFANNKKK